VLTQRGVMPTRTFTDGFLVEWLRQSLTSGVVQQSLGQVLVGVVMPTTEISLQRKTSSSGRQASRSRFTRLLRRGSRYSAAHHAIAFDRFKTQATQLTHAVASLACYARPGKLERKMDTDLAEPVPLAAGFDVLVRSVRHSAGGLRHALADRSPLFATASPERWFKPALQLA